MKRLVSRVFLFLPVMLLSACTASTAVSPLAVSPASVSISSAKYRESALVARDDRNYVEELQLMQKAVEQAKNEKISPFEFAVILQELGRAYRDTQQFDLERKCHKEAGELLNVDLDKLKRDSISDEGLILYLYDPLHHRDEDAQRESSWRESLVRAGQDGDAWHEAIEQLGLGACLRRRGKYEEAMRLFRKAEQTFSTLQGTQSDAARSIFCQADLYEAMGDVDNADRLYKKCIGLIWDNESSFGSRYFKELAYCLDCYARFLERSARASEAAMWRKRAGQLRKGIPPRFQTQ